MPSIQTFYVEFDRPNAIYAPGEIISGNIVVNLVKQKTIRALNLSAKGEAYVRWSEQVPERDSNGRIHFRTIYYAGRETYFHVTYPVLAKSKDGMAYIPAGLNRYPFHIQIPLNIPCSFEHKYGYIRYTIKAIIDRPWRFDHECKAAFTVITIYDLNAHRERCISLHDEVCKNFYTLCCFDGTMNVEITIPTTGFVPGQYIEVTLGLRNNNNIVQRVCAKLEQFLQFHAKGDFHISSTTKRDKSIVAGMQKMGPFDQNAVINLQIYVPPIPPSDLEFCSIIQLRYFLYIILEVSGLHLNISKEYPIVIGTLPLRPDPSAPMISSPPLTSTDFQSTSNEPDPLGFGAGPSASPKTSSANNYFDAPPSYEECCGSRVNNIKEHGESEYVYGANQPFAPRYPVFNFSSSYSHS
ncbi:arrestin domain-containing protein 2 [Ooceraea biroi]|uniref:Arrestin domain-containing protein n=1 Tax=Ooceraea biroi TaxID=2015173 RepID=A0A026WZB3_OOCBI|nr:arrestin domain-containing protein 2 [Ooceraea biroi]EZA61081.1 Arrestin domain-containing protein [Ooceraea biroi]